MLLCKHVSKISQIRIFFFSKIKYSPNNCRFSIILISVWFFASPSRAFQPYCKQEINMLYTEMHQITAYYLIIFSMMTKLTSILLTSILMLFQQSFKIAKHFDHRPRNMNLRGQKINSFKSEKLECQTMIQKLISRFLIFKCSQFKKSS